MDLFDGIENVPLADSDREKLIQMRDLLQSFPFDDKFTRFLAVHCLINGKSDYFDGEIQTAMIYLLGPIYISDNHPNFESFEEAIILSSQLTNRGSIFLANELTRFLCNL